MQRIVCWRTAACRRKVTYAMRVKKSGYKVGDKYSIFTRVVIQRYLRRRRSVTPDHFRSYDLSHWSIMWFRKPFVIHMDKLKQCYSRQADSGSPPIINTQHDVVDDDIPAWWARRSVPRMCFELLLNLSSSMRPLHGLAIALLEIETDLTRFFADVSSWDTQTSLHHLLKISLVTVMISYSRGLTLTASIYSSSACLIDLALVTLSDRGDKIKHL